MRQPPTHGPLRLPLIVLATLGLGLWSCADEGTDDTGFAPPATEPALLIHFTVTDPSGVTSLVSVVSDLSATQEIDVGNALEIPGYVVLAAPETRNGTFFVARSDAPELVRYQLTEQGGVEQTGRVSFAGLGATTAARMLRPIHFVSDERAYFIDSELPQAIVWNPETMEIERAFGLEGLQSTDGSIPVAFDSREDQGRLIVPTGYLREDDTYAPRGRIAIIDLETDEVTYDEQNRCGYLTTTVVDEEGSIYFVSHPGHGARYAAAVAGDPTFPPCMVRMRSGADGFDPDYFLDTTTLVNRPAASIVPGPTGQAYVTIYPEGSEAFTPENYVALRFNAAWQFHSFVIGDANATVSIVEAAPETADQVGGTQVDLGNDRGERPLTPFVTVSTTDFNSTTLYDISDPNQWTEQVTVPGFVYTVVRIR